jgi:ParB family chromosome partitioning protein
MTPRRGLGRGLDALLTSTEGEPPDLREVPTDAIRPNPYQPRHGTDDADLEELAASIRAHGIIQPLVVCPVPEGDGYQLVAGERRWRAARMAGLDLVPVVVRAANPQEMLALAIVENLQRTDLDPIEAAQAFRRLMDEFALTQREVAELVGRSRTAIANTVRLLGLAEEVQRLVGEGHLSEGHGRALLAIDDPAGQVAMARRAIAGGWTVRRVEAAVRGLDEGVEERGAKAHRERRPRRDPDTEAAARELEAALGTRVEIRRRGDGGQVVIYFYAEEELAALYDRLAEGG